MRHAFYLYGQPRLFPRVKKFARSKSRLSMSSVSATITPRISPERQRMMCLRALSDDVESTSTYSLHETFEKFQIKERMKKLGHLPNPKNEAPFDQNSVTPEEWQPGSKIQQKFRRNKGPNRPPDQENIKVAEVYDSFGDYINSSNLSPPQKENFNRYDAVGMEGVPKQPLSARGGQNEEQQPQGHAFGLEGIARFEKVPREVKATLDRFVVGQHDAKKALSVALCDHYNHARRCLQEDRGGGFGGEGLQTVAPFANGGNYVKPNVLVLGPSGCGKTHLVRTLATLIGVPFVKADATKFSATGYVGGDVEEPVKALVAAAGGDVRLAEFGIVYVDEVDKLAFDSASGGGGSGGGTVNTRDVQTGLLRVMEDGEVSLLPTAVGEQNSPGKRGGGGQEGKGGRGSGGGWRGGGGAGRGNGGLDQQKQQASAGRRAGEEGGGSVPGVLRTKHVLFIFSGAFNSLRRQVEKEGEAEEEKETEKGGGGGGGGETTTLSPASQKQSAAKRAAKRGRSKYTTKHFVDHGMEPEFMGRIPVRVSVHNLDEEDLMEILTTSEDSVLQQFVHSFEGYGIDVEFTKSALERVASLASGQGTGARGLLTVLDDVLRDFKFELPGRQLPSNSLNTKQTAAAASSAAKSANAADLVDTLLTGAFESNTASTNDGKNNSGEDSAVREGSEGNFRLLVGAEVVDDPEGALKTLLAELDQVSLQSSGQANSYKDT